MNKSLITVCLLLLSAVTSGCWNLKETNQLAIVIGGGLDINQDGRLEVSSQIAIPAGLGGPDTGPNKKRSFVVVSATGKDFMDAGQNIQTQLSRTLFYAHRQTILIGQRMAEQGMNKYLDMVVRNPKSEMRSVIFVVKDGTAKDILETEPVFDPLISTALGSVQMALGMKPFYYREFLCESRPKGGSVLLPAISIQASAKRFNYAGAAVLNKENALKLVGFLKPEESYYANWIKGRQRALIVSTSGKQNNGSISLRAQGLKSHIKVVKDSNGMRLHIQLSGTGDIVENNSSLDPSLAKDLRTIEKNMSKEAEQAVVKLIQKAQKQYKAEFFGIARHVHNKYPREWKSLQKDWNETFSKLPITVEVHLRYQDPGQTNSSI
ncbi:Ger(x)C family spore germination protein [Paenibacillus glycanilyticus]|uniref:Ger(x)C family spore germination protein n=1 Tax=Paenibacillus glycanilyticus TaxID=126569 RepID=UPI00203C57EF|nr:Ger(x)C family spore germination protein [Paenibacillus glycanilyticus]MCM3628286.1 Ger(x)C family spore germination protein [Paenibacillus glycanilyticus]